MFILASGSPRRKELLQQIEGKHQLHGLYNMDLILLFSILLGKLLLLIGAPKFLPFQGVPALPCLCR